MASLEQLQFAQKYPFTETARSAVKSMNVPLNKIGEDVRERARLRVENAFSKKPYALRIFGGDRELLENEIMSYTVAKIIVSRLEVPLAYESFAKSVSGSTLEFLRNAENQAEEMISLATELKIKFDLGETGNFLVPLTQFLSIPFNNDSLRLINNDVEKGMVFLGKDEFALFLSEKAHSAVFGSLPVKDASFPSWLNEAVQALSGSFKKRRRASFGKISARLQPELFPPCMSSMYEDLAHGKNLPHMARFSLTTFLNASGMPQEEIVRAFSSAPNYSERITRYQVKKICTLKGRGYSPPTCTKLKTTALCKANCSVKSPMQFYRNELYRGKSRRAKPAEKK